ncbi:exodeoxyribonuclease VII small subunit [Sedimentibacter acidaminivorans]|uniref:Exodeoxyribonuclease VII small subunit n=2 Tax=Sedimentibacter acidaminivorans TaxID=913099 RepID=A0ABS4GCK4_9FIRM|nr:exodeoxyribonuclease VII small subunit [Sedimentibacter acidaminivorans]
MMKNNNQNYDSFEAAFEELKQIVQNLEDIDDVSIDEMLKSYEMGMSAYSFCMEKLEDTQKKIKIIDSNFE